LEFKYPGERESKGTSVLLVDEMGLGKTIVAFVEKNSDYFNTHVNYIGLKFSKKS